MNKKIISFLSTIMLLISILPFIPIKVNAEECIYEIKISYPDRDVGLSCYQNYNDALTAMNEYPSTEMAVATIVKNGTIINAKYALAKIDVENNNIIYNTGEGFKRIYSTSQAAYYQGTSTLSSTYLTTYFNISSITSISPSRSVNAISGSIIQHSLACVLVLEFSALKVGPKV